MSNEKKYLYGDTEMTELSNQALDIFLEAMVKNNIIDSEKATELMQYRIVVNRYNFFGKLLRKLFPNKESLIFSVIKVMDSPYKINNNDYYDNTEK